jgi:hypothetical protein
VKDSDNKRGENENVNRTVSVNLISFANVDSGDKDGMVKSSSLGLAIADIRESCLGNSFLSQQAVQQQVFAGDDFCVSYSLCGNDESFPTQCANVRAIQLSSHLNSKSSSFSVEQEDPELSPVRDIKSLETSSAVDLQNVTNCMRATDVTTESVCEYCEIVTTEPLLWKNQPVYQDTRWFPRRLCKLDNHKVHSWERVSDSFVAEATRECQLRVWNGPHQFVQRISTYLYRVGVGGMRVTKVVTNLE